MGDPDLYSDESIRLTAENIIVKSAPFEAILTNKRIILVDSRKKHIPQQTILLATIRSVDMSENAIRDPVITLSVLTNTGSTRQMVLTFSKKAGGDRKRECEEWLKILKDASVSQTQTVSYTVAPAPEPEQKAEPEVTTPPQIRMTSSSAVKKKIEIARPIKKIVETGPVPPKPIETTTLPEGAFCSRCGSRVPPGSTFCNHCGTKVLLPGEPFPVVEPVIPPTPAPVTPTTPEPVIPPVPAPVIEPVQSPPVTAPVWPVITPPIPPTPPPFVPTPHERPIRPIEEIIHSIEPLIADSVPRTEPAPLIGKDMLTLPVTPPVVETPAVATEHSVPVSPPGGDAAMTPAAPGTPAPDAPAPVPPALPPVPEIRPASKKPRGIIIAALIVVILVVAAGAFVVLKPLQGTTGTTGGSPTVTPTVTTPVGTTTTVTTAPTPHPTVTTQVTTLPTTAAQAKIPDTGVWIRITYAGTFTGTYGTPSREAQVTDTGDRLYQIATADGPVVASIKKQDGSGDKLTIAVYKNGELIKTATTVSPSGTIDFLADLKTPMPTPVPTTIATTVTTMVAPVANVTATQTTANV